MVMMRRWLVLLLLLGQAWSAPGVLVLRVVDGDTLYLDGYKDSIRLIGIDAPESRVNARAQEAARRSGQDLQVILTQGLEAKAFTSKLLAGKAVSVEWDVQRRDRYGRNLAYVWVGNKNASVEIARAGFADGLTIPPNVKYADAISRAVREARIARRGLWR
jgi:micrococcal nuclease